MNSLNKNGQTLVVFILLIPIFLAICAFVIDVGLMTYESMKLKNVTKSILTNVMSKNKISEDSIIELYRQNNIKTDDLVIEITEDSIKIENNYFIPSMFGKILQIEEYEISVDVEMDILNKKITFE